MSVAIHPTAFVDKGAELGENVHIGPCAMIESDVVLGDNCIIDAFASVKQYTKLGAGSHVHSYALVGGLPQDLKFKGEITWSEIGKNNIIREFATVHRGTEGGGGSTRIGDNNLIMAYCHVAHDCQLGDNIIMSSHATLGGHVIVDDFAIIGGLSAVHQFARVGEHSFVGGMTGASQDVPPFMLASGSRATISGPNVVGLRRMGADSVVVSALRQAFKIIWLQGIPRQEAYLQVEAEFAEINEVQRLVSFLRQCQRGFLPARSNSENIS